MFPDYRQLFVHAEVKAGDDGFWVVLQEKAERIKWCLLLCLKVAELRKGGSVCFERVTGNVLFLINEAANRARQHEEIRVVSAAGETF